MTDELLFGVVTRNDVPPPARVLHDRAMALARKPERPEEAWILTDVVEFQLARETYAVESACVREVQPLKRLTPLPGTPPFIMGVVNIRGQLITVLDLRKLFELPDKGISDFDKLIILHSAGTELGILADAVIGVRSLQLGGMQPSLPTLSGVRADYLRGIADDRTILIDATRLLADRRIIVNEGA